MGTDENTGTFTTGKSCARLTRLTGELDPQVISKVGAGRCPLKRLLAAAGSTAEPGSDLTRESAASLIQKIRLSSKVVSSLFLVLHLKLL